MRYLVPLISLAILVAACGTHSSTKKPVSTAFPSPHIATIPVTTPPPTPKGGFPTANPHASPVKLPTTQPIAFPTATPLPPSAYTATLDGKVTNSKTHAPVSGATIILQVTGKTHQTTSGPSGRYHVAFPGIVSVGVTVNKKGYLSWLGMGRLKPHQTLSLTIPLIPKKAGQPPSGPAVFGKM